MNSEFVMKFIIVFYYYTVQYYSILVWYSLRSDIDYILYADTL